MCYGAELYQATDGSTVQAGRLKAEEVDSLSHVTGVGLPGPHNSTPQTRWPKHSQTEMYSLTVPEAGS